MYVSGYCALTMVPLSFYLTGFSTVSHQWQFRLPCPGSLTSNQGAFADINCHFQQCLFFQFGDNNMFQSLTSWWLWRSCGFWLFCFSVMWIEEIHCGSCVAGLKPGMKLLVEYIKSPNVYNKMLQTQRAHSSRKFFAVTRIKCRRIQVPTRSLVPPNSPWVLAKR